MKVEVSESSAKFKCVSVTCYTDLLHLSCSLTAWILLKCRLHELSHFGNEKGKQTYHREDFADFEKYCTPHLSLKLIRGHSSVCTVYFKAWPYSNIVKQIEICWGLRVWWVHRSTSPATENISPIHFMLCFCSLIQILYFCIFKNVATFIWESTMCVCVTAVVKDVWGGERRTQVQALTLLRVSFIYSGWDTKRSRIWQN